MNIANILWDRIKNIEKEIKNLKTARFKTASTISTITASGSVSLPLKIFGDPSTYYEVISSKKAIITLNTLDNTNMISALYLDGVTPSNTNNRYIFINRVASGAGQAKFELYVYSQNTNDFNTLNGGGSVMVNYNLLAVGSSRFSMSITYEDFDPWS